MNDSKPWYLSRGLWGAIIAGIAAILNLLGVFEMTAAMQAETVEVILAIATVAGAVIAFIGRWFAKTPVG